MKRLLVPMACAALTLTSARADEIRGQGLLFEPRVSASEDFQIGMKAGYGILSWEGRSVSMFVDGEIRPFAHPVYVRQSPTLTHRYMEMRGSLGPGISVALPLSETFSATAAAGAAYSDAGYWGSNRQPSTGWIGWGEAGIRYVSSPHAWLGAAAQYRPLPDIFPARIVLQYGIQFQNGLLW